MRVERFEVPTLGQGSYMVFAGEQAAVIDPERSVGAYLDAAREAGAKITWVLLTHLHEDFVAGHRELARLTGAPIGVGAGAEVAFEHRVLPDGVLIPLGAAALEVRATPGHAPEAVCFVLRGESGAPDALFSGDTLLLGDVGRVDHLGAGAETRAGQLYESLRTGALPLPPELPLFPGHFGGTLICRSPSPQRTCTLGFALARNPIVSCESREAFISWVVSGQPEIPGYFALARRLNSAGPPLLPTAGLPGVTVEELESLIQAGAPVLDARLTPEYNAGHIPGSVHVGLDGQFELWVGAAIAPAGGICVVANASDRGQVWARLARIGFEPGAVILEGGFEAWRAGGRAVATAGALSAQETAARMSEDPRWQLLDVRRLREWQDYHAPQARHVPMDELRARAAELDPGRPLAIVCRSGYRSSVASSLLETAGFRELYNVTGGMLAWRAGGLPVREG